MNDARKANGEARHPIRVVSARTGLSPDVLRAWERRYAVVEPSRTEGRQRLYTDADIERLRLLVRATGAGRQIGLIAHLSVAELVELVAEDERAAAPATSHARAAEPERAHVVDAAMGAVSQMDALRLESQLRQAMLSMGAMSFVMDVVLPLLRRIGNEWHAGTITPAHEHMATAVIRDALARLLSDSSLARAGAPLLMVATPSGERHELSSMAAAVTAAGEGWKVIYLGPDLPVSWIASAARQAGARAVAVGVVGNRDTAHAVGELAELAGAAGPSIEIFAGGPGLRGVPSDAWPARVRRVEDLAAFGAALRALNVTQGAA